MISLKMTTHKHPVPFYGRGQTLLQALASLEQSLALHPSLEMGDLLNDADISVRLMVRCLLNGDTYAPSVDQDSRPFMELYVIPDLEHAPEGAVHDYVDRLGYSQSMCASYKNDLIRLVKDGIVPINIGSFSEIHDYVDANVFGQTEQYLSQIEYDLSRTGIFNTEEVSSKAMELFTDFFNTMADNVDAWIKIGNLRAVVEWDRGEDPRFRYAPQPGSRLIDIAAAPPKGG